MDGRQHQVTGECGLNGNSRGLEVTHLADHDHVRVLAQERAQRVGRAPDLVEDFELAVSELATNVIRHTDAETISLVLTRASTEWVLDVADPANPTWVGDTVFSEGERPSAISLLGTIGYVASFSDYDPATGLLHVVDFSSPALPQVLTSMTTTGGCALRSSAVWSPPRIATSSA